MSKFQYFHKAMKESKENGSAITWQTLWEAHESQFHCNHEKKEPRFRTTRNELITYGFHCVHCGEWFRKSKKHFGWNIPTIEEDKSIQESFRIKRSESCQAASAIWSEIKSQEYITIQAEKLDEYCKYIDSQKWKAIRKKVLERDGYICCGCRESHATEVHHLTYKNFGNEFLFELVSVCNECHARIHQSNEPSVDLSKVAP